MKKIIIAAVLVFTTGILASQTKTKVIQTVPAITSPQVIPSDSKELASGD